MLNIFLIVFALIWLVIASVSDLKKREVPNWLSFSFIIFALAFRAFYAVLNSDLWFFVYGLLGFIVFFILAYAFYYARIFAGGDAKLLMGMGVVLPFSNNFITNLLSLTSFIFLLFLVGAVYSLIFSFALAVRNKKTFSKEFYKQAKEQRKWFYISFIPAVLFFILAFFNSILVFLAIIFLLFPLLYVYAKAVEEACMIKQVSSKEVTVGDWLYREIKIGKRVIKPYWEGLSEKEVALLKKYNKKILIKQGIPFVPVFLIAFVAFLLGYPYWSFFQLLF